MTNFAAYKKRRELLVIGVEATRGTAPTKRVVLPWLEKSLKTTPTILENESAIGLDTKVNDSHVDVGSSGGSIGGKVNEEMFSYLLNGMFAKVTTVSNGDGTYTHTFERDSSAQRKSLSIWDVLPFETRLYKSVYLDNLGISLEVGDSGAYLQSTASCKGWSHTVAAGFTAPAMDTEVKEFVSRQVTVKLADDVAGLTPSSAQIRPRRIDFTMEESVTVDHYIGEQSADGPEFDHAPQEVKATLVARYRSTDFEDDYFANKVHAMSIAAVNGDEKIEIIGTRVRFREVTASDGIDETVSLTANCYFESDVNNGGKDVTIKVTNRVASFA